MTPNQPPPESQEPAPPEAEELETLLLSADVGIDATTRIVADLTRRVRRHELDDADALTTALREDLVGTPLRAWQADDVARDLGETVWQGRAETRTELNRQWLTSSKDCFPKLYSFGLFVGLNNC